MGLDAVTRTIDTYLQIASEYVHLDVDPVVLRMVLSFLTVIVFGHALVERLFRAGAKGAEKHLSEGAKSGIYGMFFFSSVIVIPIFTYFDVLLGAVAAAILLLALPYYYGVKIRERMERSRKEVKGESKITHTAMELPAAQKTVAAPQAVMKRKEEIKGKEKNATKKANMPRIPVGQVFSAIIGRLSSVSKARAKKQKPDTTKSTEKSPQRVKTPIEIPGMMQTPPATEMKKPKSTPEKKTVEQTTTDMTTEKAEKKKDEYKAAGKSKKGGILSVLNIFGRRKVERKEERERREVKIKIEEITPEAEVSIKEKTVRKTFALPKIKTTQIQEIKAKKNAMATKKEIAEAREEEKPVQQEEVKRTEDVIPEDVLVFRRTLDEMEKKYILRTWKQEGHSERKEATPAAPTPEKKYTYNKTVYNRIRDALKNLLFEREKTKLEKVTWRDVRKLRKRIDEEILPTYADRIAEEAMKLGDRPDKTDVENAARRILGLPEKEKAVKEESKKKHGRRHEKKGEQQKKEEEKEGEEKPEDLIPDTEEDLTALLTSEEEGGGGEDLDILLGEGEESEEEEDLTKLLET